MKKKTFKIDNYNLHIIKSDKHKTITTTILFRKKIKKEEVTITNFLFNCLSHSTLKYPTRLSLVRKGEELYDNSIYYSSFETKDNYVQALTMESLEDKYTEEGNFFMSLDVLHEMIFNPNVDNKEFNEKAFNYSKQKLISRIKKQKENEVVNAKYELLKLMDEDAYFTINTRGYLEDIDLINRKNLYEFYLEFFKEVDIDIYVVGNIEEDRVREFITKKFIFSNNRLEDNSAEYKFKEYKEKTVIKKEKTDQSILQMGFVLDKATDRERVLVSKIYNIILSHSPSSKFFVNIREKYSICYYAAMSIIPSKSIAIMTSEIDKSSFDKMVELVKKEMNDMKLGIFSEEDIKNACTLFSFNMEDIKEFYDEYINFDYVVNLYQKITLEELIKEINSVTKQEIINFANKFNLHTIYLVGGDKND